MLLLVTVCNVIQNFSHLFSHMHALIFIHWNFLFKIWKDELTPKWLKISVRFLCFVISKCLFYSRDLFTLYLLKCKFSIYLSSYFQNFLIIFYSVIIIPFHCSSLKTKAYQQTSALTFTCLQAELNDHSASLRVMWVSTLSPPVIVAF